MQIKTLALVLTGALAMVAAETSAHAKKFRIDANGGRGGTVDILGDNNEVSNSGNGGRGGLVFGRFGKRGKISANGGNGGDVVITGNGNKVTGSGNGGAAGGVLLLD